MIDFLGDMAKGVGKIIGTATGIVFGVPITIIAETLGLTSEMVKQAMDSGCETYEEIHEFWKDRDHNS